MATDAVKKGRTRKGNAPTPVKQMVEPETPFLSEDLSYTNPTTGYTYKLTMKEKRLCEAYLSFYGNGIQAVYPAGYDVKDPNVAAAIGYENLRKPHIMACIDMLLEQYGFSDDNVEKQRLFVLNQYDDLGAKNKAIDMFYKLKGMYAPEKKDVRVVNLTELIKEKLGANRSANREDTE